MGGIDLLAIWLSAAEPRVELVGPPLRWTAAELCVEPMDDPPLRWTAPASCPDGSAVERETQRLLGGKPLLLDEVTIDGRIEANPAGGWRLDLKVVTPQGTSSRRLDADECHTLAEAAALYVALALDPMAMLAEPAAAARVDAESAEPGIDAGVVSGSEAGSKAEPEAGSDAEPESEPEPEPERASRSAFGSRSEPSGRSRVRPQWALRVQGSGGRWIHPRWGGGIGAGVSLGLPRVRVEAMAQYWFPRQFESEVLGVGTRTDLGFAELRACPRAIVRRVELLGCAGVDLGAATARGVGVMDERVARAVWFGAVVGPAVAWYPIERLGFWVELDLVGSLYRPRFAVDGLGEVLRFGAVGGRLTLGVQVEL
ncbi:MAG: hypothetical protein AAGF11_31200 [Myxococcota bacterium]